MEEVGWDKNQTGIWVSKYEMSRTDSTLNSAGTAEKFKSIAGVQSAREITIGNMYEYAKQYDSTKESHMMKNSEWGAVAYLTHSQYGRNGHEIDINNCSKYITGNGGGSTSAGATTKVTNAYNTKIGAKASTTGNIYGVYDMKGGASEYTASYDKKGGINLTKYGGNMINGKTSNKYVTAYENGKGNGIYIAIRQNVSKIGDAIKEAMIYRDTPNSQSAWFGNNSGIVSSSMPFFYRGERYSDTTTGVFSSNAHDGYDWDDISFRIVLGL